jgi:hypothetical protein
VTAEHEQGSLLLQINTVDVAADLATDVPLASGNLFFRPVWKVVYDVLTLSCLEVVIRLHEHKDSELKYFYK